MLELKPRKVAQSKATTPSFKLRLVPSADPGLSAADLRVVALSRNDPKWSLSLPGWHARILAAIFGPRMNYALADPKLEALRRYVVTARRDCQRDMAAEAVALLTVGYSAAQVTETERMVKVEMLQDAQ